MSKKIQAKNKIAIPCKIILVGESGVGKTSIISRYLNRYQEKTEVTYGAYFSNKTIIVDGYKINFEIWDTAGQERYRVVTKNYFNTSDGFLVIYDITNRESFLNINNWIEQINTLVGGNVKCIIFGNKNDLNEGRKVSIKEGEEMAKKYNCKFYETSAKEGNNLEEGFYDITKDVLGDIKIVHEKRKSTSILKPHIFKKQQKKKGCCS